MPRSYYELQNPWKNKADGSFHDFDGRTFEGVTFHQQFCMARNSAFPLDRLFETIDCELKAGRFVIVGLAAGYDGEECLELLHLLEQWALDMGDYDMVYGPDEESDDELAEDAPWTTKAQIWVWQHSWGYLPIRDRHEMLRKHLATRITPRSHQP